MEESQFVGLLAIAAGAFSITASASDWDWFMNSRKAKAWVKRIGRKNARFMYGGIGVFVCLVGLILVIVAPGDDAVVAEVEPSASPVQPQPNPSAQPIGGQPSSPLEQKTIAANTTPSTDDFATRPSTPSTSRNVTTPNVEAPQATTPESAAPADSAASTERREQLDTIAKIPEVKTPAPSVEPPKVERAPEATPTEGIDLLKRIVIQRDQMKGKWKMENGALISSKASPTILQIPVEVPERYQLTAVVEMLQGDNLASLGVVVQGRGVVAVLAGPGGDNCGLQYVDGKIARHNETSYRGAALKPGVNQIVCNVDRNHVQIHCNGKKVIDWKGNPSRLAYAIQTAAAPGNRLRVGSWDTSCRFSQLVLVPLE